MTTSFELLPEWAPLSAILITWPHKHSAWQETLANVEETYFDLTATLSHHVHLIVQAHQSIDINNLCLQLGRRDANLSQVHFAPADSNDTWARDHGPITVSDKRDGSLVALDFTFNGWGGKFPAESDNALTKTLNTQGWLLNIKQVDVVLEGGSIESDGQGTLLTTEACNLNPNRHNGQTPDRESKTADLKNWFGAEQVLWLKNGHLTGDDTDAHVDTLARFIPGNAIVFQGCQQPEDEHFTSLTAMKAELQSFQNSRGQPYELFELPLPSPCYAEDGHRLPATYANFLIANDWVLVPTYGVLEDASALAVIAEALPEHRVIGINCRPLIEEHGSLHCITMQLPKGIVPKEKLNPR